ncbi:MAG: HD domain-containing protein [Oligoflexia bacterium]|nr:HD domain-containing protein [Oligoflexia bacterium]
MTFSLPQGEALGEYVRERTAGGDPSHDFSHVLRVLANAQRLGEAVGARMEILLPAALLHDLIQVPKNHPDRAQASVRAADEARTLLRERFAYSAKAADEIATAILEHSFSSGRAPSTLESAVLQDADRLDALGAIGAVRAFSCGTVMGSALYASDDPWARDRDLDDKRFALDHFFVKLFKLAEKMNTEAGKREAARRTEFLRGFVEQLRSEIEPR